MKFSSLLNFQTAKNIFVLILVLMIFLPVIACGQSDFSSNYELTMNKHILATGLTGVVFLTKTISDQSQNRVEKVLQTARWLGAAGGSFMGVAHIYWRATGVSGTYGPMWKNLLTGIPSSIVGAYVGIKTTEWATKQIMKGSPKPGKAALKGMLYGAIDGTVTLAAGLILLLIIGHYTGTIHFNFNNEMIVFKLLGSAIAGGFVYGATFGAVVGGIGGPYISLYLKF